MGTISHALSAAVLGATALGGVMAGGTAHAASAPSASTWQDLYQVHSDGSIWHYDGVPFSGWTQLGNNPATKQVTTGGHGTKLYELDSTGTVWSDNVSNNTWSDIDSSTTTTEIASNANNLYQLEKDGSIVQSDGGPIAVRTTIGDQSTDVAIAASETNLYALGSDGMLRSYNGSPESWTALDNNPATIGVAANDKNGSVFELHKDGSIWQYTGTPLTGWRQIGDNAAAVSISGSPTAGYVYEYDSTGTIWQYNGSTWTRIDDNTLSAAITVGDDGSPYQIQKGIHRGFIYQYVGTPISGWNWLDSNYTATAVVAGDTRSAVR